MSRGGYRGGVRVADKVDLVYAVIARAARQGEAAPKNEDFATAVGSSTVGGIPAYLRMLQAQGRVVIDGEQGRKARRFYVPAIEMWTGWSNKACPKPVCRTVPAKPGSPAPTVPDAPPAAAAKPIATSVNLLAYARGAGEPALGRTVPRSVAPIQFTTCQFIAGDPRDRGFCGEAVKPGSPYCPDHHARCYRPAPEDGAGEPASGRTVRRTGIGLS